MLEREELITLIDGDFTDRQIGRILECSESSVRHWLAMYGIQIDQPRAGRRDPGLVRVRRDEVRYVLGECPQHGLLRFVASLDGTSGCTRCRAERVVQRRRAVKQTLVQECGGGCVVCGYDRSPAVLEFHHAGRELKRFTMAGAGTSFPLHVLREEAVKCVLLCRNCRIEVQAGMVSLPIN